MSKYLVTVANGQFDGVVSEGTRDDIDYTLSADLHTLKVDGWLVELNFDYPGRIVILHTIDHGVDYKRSMTLANGTIALQDTPAPLASWKERCLANSMLQECFGIRKCVPENPNTVFEGRHDIMYPDSHFEALCVLSDGKTAYSCRDDYTDGVYVADSLKDEELHFWAGPMRCTVSDAKWAVVINEKFDEEEGVFCRSVLLYTQHRNPFLLALSLEEFLAKNGYGSFTDVTESLKTIMAD